jgi:hypothetical protein
VQTLEQAVIVIIGILMQNQQGKETLGRRKQQLSVALLVMILPMEKHFGLFMESRLH